MCLCVLFCLRNMSVPEPEREIQKLRRSSLESRDAFIFIKGK